MDQSLNEAQLRWMLEDLQASLAVSLARLQVVRHQNRALRAEAAQLRSGSERAEDDEPPSPACSISFPQQREVLMGLPSNSTAGRHQVSLLSEPAGKEKVHSAKMPQEGANASAGGRRAGGSGGGGFFCCFTPPRTLEEERPPPPPFSDLAAAAAAALPDEASSPSGLRAAAGGDGGGGSTAGPSRVWQVAWTGRDGKALQKLVFEADDTGIQALQRTTERWMGVEDPTEVAHQLAASGSELAPPQSLVIGDLSLQLAAGSEPSQALAAAHLAALASGLPPMKRLVPWRLSYSTGRHGTSLATLYRRSAGQAPTLLVVRDTGGYIFGCYSEDGWRVSPRFYGNGEMFVFQLEPHRIMYPWRSISQAKNDFFQYATAGSLAVGGLGHFALYLDSELLHGSSSTCGTFGSPCLASRDDFKVSLVEVWQAVQ